MRKSLSGLDWEDIGRGVLAVTTFGASEAVRAISPAKWRDEIDRVSLALLTGGASEAAKHGDELKRMLLEAARVGWDEFEASILQSLRSLDLRDIRSIRDVFDVLKLTATMGVSAVLDAGMAAVQGTMGSLINPYLAKLARLIGENYALGERKVRNLVDETISKWGANRVTRKVIAELVAQLYSTVLGNPTCMCERACSKPVADGLANAGQPIVKMIGKILQQIYPILQGDPQGSHDAPALWLYAGARHAAGLELLPNAKLPRSVGNLANHALEQLGDKSIGMPQAFERYRPWLTDLVARGYQGPRVLGGSGRSARWYFDHPDEARRIVERAEEWSGWLYDAKRYLDMADKALDYAKEAKQAYDKARDVYSAARSSNFRFDLHGFAAGMKQYGAEIKDSLRKFVSWKTKELERLVHDAPDQAKRQAAQYGLKRLNELKTEIKETTGFEALETLRSEAKDYGFSFKGLGSVADTAQAFLGEWMLATIGLEARAKWNDLALLWCSMTPAQRAEWRKGSTWASAATSRGDWARVFDADAQLSGLQSVTTARQQALRVLREETAKAQKAATRPAGRADIPDPDEPTSSAPPASPDTLQSAGMLLAGDTAASILKAAQEAAQAAKPKEEETMGQAPHEEQAGVPAALLAGLGAAAGLIVLALARE